MKLLLYSSIIAILIPIILLIVSYIIFIRTTTDREKSTPFECGFDPNHKARIPFSIRFFLLAVIFIVFDIEIVLLIPIPVLILTNSPSQLVLGGTLFLVILILGLLHEWNEGSLD
jgi:NADH-ubiquinone oxidoreductase chain 3